VFSEQKKNPSFKKKKKKMIRDKILPLSFFTLLVLLIVSVTVSALRDRTTTSHSISLSDTPEFTDTAASSSKSDTGTHDLTDTAASSSESDTGTADITDTGASVSLSETSSPTDSLSDTGTPDLTDSVLSVTISETASDTGTADWTESGYTSSPSETYSESGTPDATDSAFTTSKSKPTASDTGSPDSSNSISLSSSKESPSETGSPDPTQTFTKSQTLQSLSKTPSLSKSESFSADDSESVSGTPDVSDTATLSKSKSLSESGTPQSTDTASFATPSFSGTDDPSISESLSLSDTPDESHSVSLSYSDSPSSAKSASLSTSQESPSYSNTGGSITNPVSRTQEPTLSDRITRTQTNTSTLIFYTYGEPLPEPAIITAITTTVIGGITGLSAMRAVQATALLLSTCYANRTETNGLVVFHDLSAQIPELGRTGGLVFMAGLVLATFLLHVIAVLILVCARKCKCACGFRKTRGRRSPWDCSDGSPGHYEAHPDDLYDAADEEEEEEEEESDSEAESDAASTAGSEEMENKKIHDNNNKNHNKINTTFPPAAKYKKKQTNKPGEDSSSSEEGQGSSSGHSAVPVSSGEKKKTQTENSLNKRSQNVRDAIKRRRQVRKSLRNRDPSFSVYWDEASASLGFPSFSLGLMSLCFPGIVSESAKLTAHYYSWYKAYGFLGLVFCLGFVAYVVIRTRSIREQNWDIEGEGDDDVDELINDRSGNASLEVEEVLDRQGNVIMTRKKVKVPQTVSGVPASKLTSKAIERKRIRLEALHIPQDQVEQEEHDMKEYWHQREAKKRELWKKIQEEQKRQEHLSPVRQIAVHSPSSVSQPHQGKEKDPFAININTHSRRESVMSTGSNIEPNDPRLAVVLKKDIPTLPVTSSSSSPFTPHNNEENNTSGYFNSEEHNNQQEEPHQFLTEVEQFEQEEKMYLQQLEKRTTFWPAPHYFLFTYRFGLRYTNRCTRFFYPRGMWNSDRKLISQTANIFVVFTPVGALWFPTFSFLFVMIVAIVQALDTCSIPVLVWGCVFALIAIAVAIFRPCRYILDNFLLSLTYAGAAATILSLYWNDLRPYHFNDIQPYTGYILYLTIAVSFLTMVHRLVFWIMEEFIWKDRELPRRFPCPPRRGQTMMDIIKGTVHPGLYNEFIHDEMQRVQKEEDAEFKSVIAPHVKVLSENESVTRRQIENEEGAAFRHLMLQKPSFSDLELKKAAIENRRRELEERQKKKEPIVLGTVKKMPTDAARSSLSPAPERPSPSAAIASKTPLPVVTASPEVNKNQPKKSVTSPKPTSPPAPFAVGSPSPASPSAAKKAIDAINKARKR
jgi:hypothetical protein